MWVLFVVGSLCVISLLVVACLVAPPMVQQSREAARRQKAAENLKNIARAMQNYEAASQASQAPKATVEPRTVDEVRQIVSEQLGIEVNVVNERTSLAEVGADELDFVELVMELEEHFSISIPDESFLDSAGKVLGPSQFGELTVLRLAEIVDLKRKSEN